MKNSWLSRLLFHLIFLLSLSPFLSSGQGWERFEIGGSGCTALMPYQPEWELSHAYDSSLVWVGEAFEDNIYYGIICVEFSVSYAFESTKEDLSYLAQGYLDFLQTEFSVVSHSGYVTGMAHASNDEATGVSDTWTDSEGDPWFVTAWIDPFNLVVMYMYSDPETDMSTNSLFFFESLRFPE